MSGRQHHPGSRGGFAVRFAATLLFAQTACGDVNADLVTGGGAGSSAAGTGTGGASPDAGIGGSGAAAGSGAISGGAGSGGCQSSADCTSGDSLYCHPDQRRCVECVTDAHCDESEERCSTALGECAEPCAGDEDCVSDDPFCDTVIGFCVECLSDGDCEDDRRCRSSECQ